MSAKKSFSGRKIFPASKTSEMMLLLKKRISSTQTVKRELSISRLKCSPWRCVSTHQDWTLTFHSRPEIHFPLMSGSFHYGQTQTSVTYHTDSPTAGIGKEEMSCVLNAPDKVYLKTSEYWDRQV